MVIGVINFPRLLIAPLAEGDLALEFLKDFAASFGEEVVSQAAQSGVYYLFAIQPAHSLRQVAPDTLGNFTMVRSQLD